MTDYYPLLARAVAGLEKSTGEARRALYERARNALVEQLRNSDPPLSESEITRERLALEEAVRKVEGDAARQMRAPPPPPVPPPANEPRAPLPRRDTGGPLPPPPLPAPPPRAPADQNRPPLRTRPADGAPPTGDGTHGMRDVVVEAESLGEATAQAARSAREAYASMPSNVPDLDRLEPRMEPEGLRNPPRGGPRPTPRGRTGELPPTGMPPSAPQDPPRRRAPGPMPRRPVELDRDEGASSARRGLVAALLTVLIITGLGGTAYWQRDKLSSLFGTVKGLGPQTTRDQGQPRSKSPDRVGQDGQPAPAQTGQPQGTPGTPPAMVAQRVVLYEEDPANPEGNRYVGSALWRTETVSPGPGMSPELAVRADVEIPERRLAMTLSIRRNTDPALPASHTVEILFNLPPDFTFGGVANVPGLLMKEAEQARGSPLSGLAVKVTNGFFLIGLSAVEADVQRNLQLLKERAWFDIPMVYNNGRRAILAIEKGTPGERAFAEGFAAWTK
jgi:hypothetical protein